MRRYPSLFAIMTVALCLATSPIEARWANSEDAPAEIELLRDIVIDKDGNFDDVIEKRVKILKETGRETFGVERIYFNETSEKVEIIEAKVVYEGKTCSVPKEMIEIKPLASDIKGFDQLFQILVSYPHVRVGAELCLKYKVSVLKQPLPRYFCEKYYYGMGACWKAARLRIKSELPLLVLPNDPDGHFKVKKGKEGQYQTLEFVSQKPAYNDLMNESHNNQVPDHKRTWVILSTYETFEEMSKALSKDYDKSLEEELPLLQRSIQEAAATLSNPVDQINKVTSLLSEKIRYMGDWRTIEGKFCPRPLKTVAESGVGDCKDFAVSTAAILRALGFKAQVALVMRGTMYLAPERTLPGVLNFNHAIVKATTKDGRVFWIDPTNFVSMAEGVFPDIANRPALVLDSRNPSYESISNIDYTHAKVSVENTMSVKADGVLVDEGTITLFGEKAQDITGAELGHSLQAIQESIIRQLSGEASPSRKEVILPPLDSRIVKDIKVQYAYEQDNNLLLTNTGPAISMQFSWSQPFIETSGCQKGTTFIGFPSTLVRKTIVRNVGKEGLENVAYAFQTPWVKAKRECKPVKDGIEINEEIFILKSFITAEEVASPDYQNLKKLIKKYCQKLAIIVSQPETPKNLSSPLATRE